MRRIASLLAAALLAGCAGAAPSSPQAPDREDTNVHETAPQTVTLGVGERATLADDSQLTYLRLVNDSRCLPDVQCVWAGDAELAFTWRAAGGAVQAFSLHTGKGAKTQALGERTLVLVSVARGPAPEAQLRIER